MALNILLAAIVVVLLIPLALTFIWAITIGSVIRSSAKWPHTEGVITGSHLVRNYDCNGLPGYHYCVSYEYAVDGEGFIANTVRSGSYCYFSKKAAQRTVETYPIEKPVRVYYDPEYPDCAVLVPGWHPECLYSIAVFGIVALMEATLVMTLIFRLAL
jgi:hypothetical protein